MNIRGIILFLSLIALFSSCNYIKNVGLLNQVEIRRTNYVQAIPFEMRKDIIVVRARLNADTVEREFIFDSGAFNSKIESSLAEGLRLEVVATKSNSTAQGITREIEVVRLDSLRLGETTIYSVGAGKLEYDKTSASPCIAGDGIIGGNIIKLAHWKIDYANQLIYFSDKPFDLSHPFFELPFERPTLSGTPKVDIQVSERTIEGVNFDLGYNGGLVLPLSFESAFHSTDSMILLDKSSSGIYGTNRDSVVVKFLEVNIAGWKKVIPVEFSSLNKALIGNEILKHFEVSIDYNEDLIHLHQLNDVIIHLPRAFSISIVDDSVWVVSRTQPKGLFHLGDTLSTVNGLKAQDIFSSYCEFVMENWKLYSDTLLIESLDGKTYMLPPQ